MLREYDLREYDLREYIPYRPLPMIIKLESLNCEAILEKRPDLLIYMT